MAANLSPEECIPLQCSASHHTLITKHTLLLSLVLFISCQPILNTTPLNSNVTSTAPLASVQNITSMSQVHKTSINVCLTWPCLYTSVYLSTWHHYHKTSVPWKLDIIYSFWVAQGLPCFQMCLGQTRFLFYNYRGATINEKITFQRIFGGGGGGGTTNFVCNSHMGSENMMYI